MRFSVSLRARASLRSPAAAALSLVLGLIQPLVAQAAPSDEIVTIIVRFADGEVTLPEHADDNTVPIQEIAFKTQELRVALANSGVFALTLVCADWRNLEAPQHDVDGMEIDVAQMVDFKDVYRLEWDRSVAPEDIGSRLRSFDQVVYVDLMPFIDLLYDPPDDPFFSGQWGLHNTGQTFPNYQCEGDYDINALEAWDFQDSSLVLVGVLDQGIDRHHEDLVDAVHPSLSFGPNLGQEECDTWPHGTAIAGIVGATGGNGVGTVGVASPKGGPFLVPMRANSLDSGCSLDAGLAVDALAWVTSSLVFPQVRIVNNSWGGPRRFLEEQGYYATVRDAFRNAYLKGLFLTAASGNGSETGVPPPHYPAAFPDYTEAVAAVLCDGAHPPDYPVGGYIDVAAPGGHVAYNGDDPDSLGHIKTTWGDDSDNKYWGMGGIQHFGGTSASCAFVSGVAALLWSVPTLTNSLTNDDLAGVLAAAARDLGTDGPDPLFGYGIVRADSALKLIAPPHSIVKNSAPITSITYLATRSREFMNIPCVTQAAETPEELTVEIYEMLAYAPFTEPALAVWVRGRQSNGWRDLRYPPISEETGPIDGRAYYNWGEVDTSSVTPQGCWLRSYTCKFFRDGQLVGWYPVNGSGLPTCVGSSSAASLAYTYVTQGGSPRGVTSPELVVRVETARGSAQRFRFSWNLFERADCEVGVFDVAGRRIRSLFSGPSEAGQASATWDGRFDDGREAPVGLYFLRVRAGKAAATSKLLVLGNPAGAR